MKPPKITFYVPLEHLGPAASAAAFAISGSGFSGGFAIIATGKLTFAIKRNRAGFSVWLQDPVVQYV